MEAADEAESRLWNLHAPDAERLAVLKVKLETAGAKELVEIPALNMLQLRASRKEWNTFAAHLPTWADTEADVVVWLPDEQKVIDYSGRPVGHRLLEWLGVDDRLAERGSEVKIAVLDTALQESDTLNGARIDVLDLYGLMAEGNTSGHGTAVASILVGQSDVRGIVPDATLLSIPVMNGEGEGSAFQVASGIVAAVDAGASVITMSLGTPMDSMVLREAVAYAAEKGVAVVASTGNDGGAVCYPAAYPSVIAVGAVDAAGEYAAFSNIGPQVDVTAPGVGVAAGWSEGAEIVGFSGTSASAPCVAGVIAYVMSQDRSLSATEAAAQVLANADDNGAPDVDDYYGVGLLNAQRSVQAKTPGIHEVAAAGHDVGERTEGGAYPVTVSAQNRGTEVVTSVELTGIVDGKSKTMTFNNVAPGQVVSLVVEVSEQAVAGERPIEVESAVVSPDGQDDWQGNNQRRSILTFREE